MIKANGFEFPLDKQKDFEKAKKLEKITVFYLISVVIIMYLSLGSSQAMKTAWLEDCLSLIPPLSFLIASKIAHKEPTNRFPYGFHKVTAISFLCSSLALFSLGCWLFIDSIITLVTFEHPSIGTITLFGYTFWQGWLMIVALIYSGLPSVILGHLKLPLASSVHDKVLYADASMNKADWQTAAAAILGIIGIGFGLWWADSVAALIISFSVLKDGFTNLKQVIFDLIDEAPKKVEEDAPDKLPKKIRDFLMKIEFVEDADVRMREYGHVYFGEAFVVLKKEFCDIQKLEKIKDDIKAIDWKIHDFVIVPVNKL